MSRSPTGVMQFTCIFTGDVNALKSVAPFFFSLSNHYVGGGVNADVARKIQIYIFSAK
jgi:hypothetical protein